MRFILWKVYPVAVHLTPVKNKMIYPKPKSYSLSYLEMVMPGAGADKRPLQVVFTAPQRKMILKHLWWFDWGVDQYQ